MYAVFRTGGKQYRASTGERIRLEKLEAEEGASVNFDEVLLVGEGSDIKVGSPYLAGTTVSATVLKQGKSKKVSVVKFKRRQNYLRQGTHRQFFTEVEITDISSGAAKKAPKKEAAPVKEAAPKAEAPKSDAPKSDTPKAEAVEAKPTTKKEAATTAEKAESKPTTKKKVAKKAATKKKATVKKAATKKKVTKKAEAKKSD